MRGFLRLRSGFGDSSICRRRPVEAEKRVGWLDMVVIRYERRIWEMGSAERGAMVGSLSAYENVDSAAVGIESGTACSF